MRPQPTTRRPNSRRSSGDANIGPDANIGLDANMELDANTERSANIELLGRCCITPGDVLRAGFCVTRAQLCVSRAQCDVAGTSNRRGPTIKWQVMEVHGSSWYKMGPRDSPQHLQDPSQGARAVSKW